MAGFKLAGANSSVTFANLTVGVKNYSLSPAADKLETTTFADAIDNVLWETNMAGMLRGGEITLGVIYDSTNTVALADSGTITLTLEAGKTISATAWVKTIPYSGDVAGLIEQTIIMQITGPVTFPA